MQVQKPAHRSLLPLASFDGSLSSKVFFSLKDAIFSLKYQPGEILRKGEVCEVLGVSRSPVSEAIAKLANEGLVNIVPQAGTYISLLSMDRIREGAFTREALELAAVEMVAKAITDPQLASLHENLQRQQSMIDNQDISGFFQIDQEMHKLIFSFTGFHNLAKMADYSWVQVDRARSLHLPSPGRVQDTLKEHREIFQALESRNPKQARKVTRKHLGQLIKYLEPLVQSHPEQFEPADRKPG